MRLAMIIEYDGSNYSGWQRQKNGVSIQEKVEEALSKLFSKKITIYGSGRTDKGVHAEGQVAHFDVETELTPFKIMGSINFFLPDDIVIKDVFVVASDFHAQFDAKSKIYVYNTYVSRINSPLKSKYYVQIVPPLDIDLMRTAAKKLVGSHNFAAFAVKNGDLPSTTIRAISRIDIIENGENITFEVEGPGFLYRMVRSIVGTLVWIGRGKLPIDAIDDMLKTGCRSLGGKTLAPNGLVLKKVIY
jgi:tRNA pseudouridine38-40 synthase